MLAPELHSSQAPASIKETPGHPVLKKLQGALVFADREAVGGLTLMAAAAAALILSNAPTAPAYFALFETPVAVRVGELAIDKPLLLWINDGLMAVFFLLVGLEIKRELLVGELSTRRAGRATGDRGAWAAWSCRR